MNTKGIKKDVVGINKIVFYLYVVWLAMEKRKREEES
jgi:hypothetical protein